MGLGQDRKPLPRGRAAASCFHLLPTPPGALAAPPRGSAPAPTPLTCTPGPPGAAGTWCFPVPTLPPVRGSPHLTGPRHSLDARSLRMKSQGARVSELGLCSPPQAFRGGGASGRALCCRAFQDEPGGRGQDPAGAQGRQIPRVLCFCLYWLVFPPQGVAGCLAVWGPGHRVCMPGSRLLIWDKGTPAIRGPSFCPHRSQGACRWPRGPCLQPLSAPAHLRAALTCPRHDRGGDGGPVWPSI